MSSLKLFGSALIFMIVSCSGAALAVDEPSVSIPSMKINERLLPINAIKANSEVQIRRVQKMMAENRDQTFGVLNDLKFLSRTEEK